MNVLRVGAIVAVMALWSPATVAQSADTKLLLDRTTAYVAEFVSRFANVVAEERYVQKANPNNPGPGPLTRELVSDFLLVAAQGSPDWHQFRDVREVDGKPVGDREQRLTTLFLQPWDTAIEQAARITSEGARYNLVDVGTVNYPLVAMAFLQREYRDRFQFSAGGLEKSLGPRVRALNFQEPEPVAHETILPGVRSSGRALVDEADGRVMKTELRLRSRYRRFTIEIDTTFAFDERLQVAVPVEMRDSYPLYRDMSGVATYGRFRSFQVRTEETVKP
jgi:hypothetical protein